MYKELLVSYLAATHHLFALLNFGLGCCEAGDRHTERRAGYVVNTDAVEELD